ncbi:MAG: DUF2752 domain-containing protein [Bacteroidales bacterium]|nr:DUF2752 domain-containing protein [Bacteroidales bacterium]
MNIPMLPCIYKQLFGISCPLCGFQRSLVCLLQGDILGNLKMFPPFFFLVFTILISIMYYIRKRNFKSKFIKGLWVTLFAFLIANAIYQNLIMYNN